MRKRILQSAGVALSSLLSVSLAYAQEGNVRPDSITAERRQDQSRNAAGALLTPGSTIGDILGHPAFAGFGRQILPWDGRAYDANLRLRDIGSLLPYHSDVEPGAVVPRSTA